MLKNKNRSAIDKVNASNYVVPKGEERYYHVKLEVPQHDPHTGEKVSFPYIQKFTAKMYKARLSRTLKLRGYKTEILYDPTEYLKKVAAESKLSREERIKAKLMEDLRAAGVLKDPKEKSEEQIRKETIEELKKKGLLKEESGEPDKKGSKGKKDDSPAKGDKAPESSGSPASSVGEASADETPAEESLD